MSDPAKATKIRIYSWPFLWMYWPVYRALRIAAKEKTQCGLTVECEWITSAEQGKDFTTDKQVYEAVRAAANQTAENELVAYLADPGQIPDVQSENWIIVPLLWRLPHWLLCNGTTKSRLGEFNHGASSRSLRDEIEYEGSLMPLKAWLDSDDQGSSGINDTKNSLNGFSVVAYPSESTSGEIAGIIMGDNQFTPVSSIEDVFAKVSNDSTFAVSFTPLHRIFRPNVRTLARYVGRLSPITSLCFYRKNLKGISSADLETICGRIREEVMQQIEALYLTQGTPARIEKYLNEQCTGAGPIHARYISSPTVNEYSFLLNPNTDGISPSVLATRRLAESLSSYIVHTAYFPYHVIAHTSLSLITQLVQSGIERAAGEVKHQVRTAIASGFQNKRWHEFTIPERFKATMQVDKGSNGQVFSIMSHDRSEMALETAVVRFHDRSVSCAALHRPHATGDYQKCRKQASVDCADHQLYCLQAQYGGKLCPKCYLAGYDRGIAELIKERARQRNYQVQVTIKSKQANPSPFTAEDLFDFCDVLFQGSQINSSQLIIMQCTEGDSQSPFSLEISYESEKAGPSRSSANGKFGRSLHEVAKKINDLCARSSLKVPGLEVRAELFARVNSMVLRANESFKYVSVLTSCDWCGEADQIEEAAFLVAVRLKLLSSDVEA